MSILAAIIAGVIGTLVFTVLMGMAPKMSMPKMDMVGMLGSMFGAPGSRVLGWVIHLMMGVVFALIYTYLWSIGVGSATVLFGLLFGFVHWLIVGLMMGVIPMMHLGIKSGAAPAPGVYMTHNGGVKGFIGGLMGHLVFGLVVSLVYPFI